MADTLTSRALESGENTSEGKQTAATHWWANIVIIAGLITSIAPEIIEAIRNVPGAESSKAGASILSILGIVLSIAGIISKGLTAASFNSGRSLIKAAAVRDSSPATPVTTVTTNTPEL